MDEKAGAVRAETKLEDLLERVTLCLPDFEKDAVSHCGDDDFKKVLHQYYPSPESNASERLIQLKTKLKGASTHDFWGILMEEMCDITGAQCGFVAKRILVDDEHTAVEMPQLGEPGSCLLGVAFYVNDGTAVKNMFHDYRYHAYGSPCAYMKHDKVFVIPERMADFIRNNPNKLPWEKSEAFIGVPLFHEEKSFAHFGMIWSTEGASKRQLSWAFIEMFLHSLEDMILQRLLDGRGFAKLPADNQSAPARLIPLDAITASQSLKPYARSLSHELRTPMQGVVGMLDIMHSTVIDAMETQTTRMAKMIFEELKANIEIVQESSKRAVEAADNVVHAYDLNMQMPDTPLVTDNDTRPEDTLHIPRAQESQRPDIVIEGNGISLSPTGRKRMRSEELDFHPGPPLKRLTGLSGVSSQRDNWTSFCPTTTDSEDMTRMVKEIFAVENGRTPNPSAAELSSRSSSEGRSPPRSTALSNQINGNVVIREFMHTLVNDFLRNIHPLQKDCSENEFGETFLVKRQGSRGQVDDLIIELFIDPDVPDTITAGEHHLQFALHKVIDNAMKFTDSGTIRIAIGLGRSMQIVEIRVSDTGCGITEESKAHLFKPHFQEDASISRAKDGLGLSLFNAKAHVRKNLGGDLTLVRSSTEGTSKGSEFLIRLPMSGPLDSSRPNTPRMGTPVPSSHPRSRQGSPRLATMSNLPALPPAPTSVPPPPLLHQQHLGIISSPLVSKISKRRRFNPNLAKEVPLNFLVAEDNLINRQILVGYLKKLGYGKENITQAYDGVEAVQQYRASLLRPYEKRINAILMDLWMPNMDGYEATEKILKIAQERQEDLAIMAVTADITSDSLDRARATGMQGFISKPYKVLDIEHLILEHFMKDRFV